MVYKIEIKKLEIPVITMDKSRPMKYAVLGPGAEYNMFYTRKNAEQFKSIRKKSDDEYGAIKTYARL